MQTTKHARGTLLPPSTLRFVYLLYKLLNWPDGLPSSGTFMACCTSYRTRQTDSFRHFYDLLHVLPNRPNGLSPSGTFTACSIAKHRISQTDFYPLTLDDSIICNQLWLGGDQGLGRRLIYMPSWICKHHSNSCFKMIGRRGPVVMRKVSLIRMVWYWCNEVDRRTNSGREEGWRMKLTSHV